MRSFWTDRQTFVYDRTLSDLLCKKECLLCWTNESIHTGLCTINGGAPVKVGWTLRIWTDNISFGSKRSGDLNGVMNFPKHVFFHKIAKLTYFAKQNSILESPDHVLQNDI